jgi:MATE family multidrug resistance protein
MGLRLSRSLRFRLKRWVAHGSLALRAATGGRPSVSSAAAKAATRVELVALAWPMAVAMAGDTLMGLVDTKLVGGLGASALGGVGFATTLMYLGYSIMFGIMRGVKVRTAFAVGQNRAEDGFRYAQAGMLMGALIGSVIFAFGRDISWLITALHLDPSLVEPATKFFAVVTFGAPASGMLVALSNHRQSIGDSRSPMVVGLLANIINAALAYVLIYGHAGMPPLGVAGAGIATAFVQYLEVFLLGRLFLRDMARSPRSSLSLRSACREVLALGLPIGLQFGTETLAFTAFTAILGSLSTTEIASHQVAMQIIRTSFLPGIAVGEAASILVGRALGQRRLDEADRVTRASLALAVGFMACCGVVFATLGGVIVRGFSHDAEVIVVARRLLLVAALFQVLDAVNIVLRGALRGARDVRVVALVGVGVIWTCIPTAAFFLGKLARWGAVGGWFGFVAETTLAATLLWFRYFRGSWRAEYRRPLPVNHAPDPEDSAVIRADSDLHAA